VSETNYFFSTITFHSKDLELKIFVVIRIFLLDNYFMMKTKECAGVIDPSIIRFNYSSVFLTTLLDIWGGRGVGQFYPCKNFFLFSIILVYEFFFPPLHNYFFSSGTLAEFFFPILKPCLNFFSEKLKYTISFYHFNSMSCGLSMICLISWKRASKQRFGMLI